MENNLDYYKIFIDNNGPIDINNVINLKKCYDYTCNLSFYYNNSNITINKNILDNLEFDFQNQNSIKPTYTDMILDELDDKKTKLKKKQKEQKQNNKYSNYINFNNNLYKLTYITFSKKCAHKIYKDDAELEIYMIHYSCNNKRKNYYGKKRRYYTDYC